VESIERGKIEAREQSRCESNMILVCGQILSIEIAQEKRATTVEEERDGETKKRYPFNEGPADEGGGSVTISTKKMVVSRDLGGRRK